MTTKPHTENLSTEAPSPHPEERGRCVAVVGVTASGKSALAMELAGRVGGEIVSTDSLQVYRHLDIGTAKPSPADRALVAHHLIDVAEPDESYSAGRFVEQATAAMAEIRARGRAPILCGGTGLYFKALSRGLSPIPPVSQAVRDEVAAMAAGGLAACRAELERVDPAAAARIHPNDKSRIVRALEVYRATGRPLSDFQQAAPFGAPSGRMLSIGIHWERPALHERIAERTEAMLGAGWIEEMERILEMGYAPTCKPLQSIGYREIGEVLRGERPRDTLASAIAVRTRQYAKRQETWFRHQTPAAEDRVVWTPSERSGDLLEEAERFLAERS